MLSQNSSICLRALYKVEFTVLTVIPKISLISFGDFLLLPSNP